MDLGWISSLVLWITCSVAHGLLDSTLTIMSKYGRLTNDPTYITCLSELHTPENLQFDRVLNTGQDSSLPANKIYSVQTLPQPSKMLTIPPSTDDKDRRFGAFACQVTDKNVTTSVVTLKQPSREKAEVIPRLAYMRANVNDSVVIQMQRGVTRSGVRLIWRHKGDKQTHSMDRLAFSRSMAKLKDAGIYELFYEHRRKYGLHGIMRLIVRDCAPNRYGHMCEFLCPQCFNGGICHERTGVCICPPGFGGRYCEQACGFNRFGSTCGWLCDPSDNPNGGGCGHYLFCRPDPYGCSCGSGFYGIDCSGVCPAGKFGPDCSQECRCSGSATCDAITGRCSAGCLLGWKGESCQEQALGKVLELQFWHTRAPDQVRLTWKPPLESNGDIVYTTERQLVQQLACSSEVDDENPVRQRTREPEILLRDLMPHSTYTVSVFGSSAYTSGDATIITLATNTAAPTGKPTNLDAKLVSSDRVDWTWDAIPCEEANGPIDMYEGELWPLPEAVYGSGGLQQITDSDLKALAQYTTAERMRADGTSMSFVQLIPYHSYAFRVQGRVGSKAGPWSDIKTIRTEHSVPPPPELLLRERTANTLTLGIVTPDIPPGVVRQVHLRGWEEEASNNSDDLGTPSFDVIYNVSDEFSIHNFTVFRLHPFTLYMIQGQISTKKGWGNWSSFIQARTDETYPSSPRVEVVSVTETSLQLQVDPPVPKSGIIIQYRVRIAGPRASGVTPSIPVIAPLDGSTNLIYNVEDLVPLTRYQVQVQASTNVGWGNWSEPLDVWTKEGVPEAPSSLSLVSFNGTSLQIEWTPPRAINGRLTSYEVTYVPQFAMDSDVHIEELRSESFKVDGSTNSIVLGNLEPLTKYSVRVKARNQQHRGAKISRDFMTGLLPPPPLVCFPNSSTHTMVPVRIEPMKTPSTTISLYQVIVQDASREDPIDESLLTNYEEAHSLGLSYYIAVEVNETEVEEPGLLLYIGNEQHYGVYWNAPLSSDQNYHFFLRVVVMQGEANYTSISSQTSEPLTVSNVPAAIQAKPECLFYDPKCLWFPFVVVGCAVLFIWAVTSIIIYKCSSKYPKSTAVPPDKAGSSSSIAWSVAYRKGFGGTSSEASTLVKDHTLL